MKLLVYDIIVLAILGDMTNDWRMGNMSANDKISSWFSSNKTMPHITKWLNKSKQMTNRFGGNRTSSGLPSAGVPVRRMARLAF